MSKRKASKAPKNRFSKNWKENTKLERTKKGGKKKEEVKKKTESL
jgi:hypothetical protein